MFQVDPSIRIKTSKSSYSSSFKYYQKSMGILIGFIKIAAQLKVYLSLIPFEGGTYMGNTALAMSSLFGKVLTVEKSPFFTRKPQENFSRSLI